MNARLIIVFIGAVVGFPACDNHKDAAHTPDANSAPLVAGVTTLRSAANPDSDILSITIAKLLAAPSFSAPRKDRDVVMKSIGPDTPPDAPAINFIRENLIALGSAKFLDWLSVYEDSEDSCCKNPEIARLVYQYYLNVRSEGMFWKTGVQVLGKTGYKEIAPALFEDWKKLPRPDRSRIPARSAEVMIIPKDVLAEAIFRLNNKDVNARIFAEFPNMDTEEQQVIATYVGRTAEPLMIQTIVDASSFAKSGKIRELMLGAPSVIIMEILSGKTPEDAQRLIEKHSNVLKWMDANGLVVDELARIYPARGK